MVSQPKLRTKILALKADFALNRKLSVIVPVIKNLKPSVYYAIHQTLI